jgi:hypothetical protein
LSNCEKVIRISSRSGTQVGSTQLVNSGQGTHPFWIQRHVVIAQALVGSSLGFGFWNYPAGGSPTATVANNGYAAAAVSLAN